MILCRFTVKLGVDPKQANQMVRGNTSTDGTEKDLKVLALVTADKESEAKDAGADYVDSEEYIEKLKEGWTDVDGITMPSVMGKLGALAYFRVQEKCPTLNRYSNNGNWKSS